MPAWCRSASRCSSGWAPISRCASPGRRSVYPAAPCRRRSRACSRGHFRFFMLRLRDGEFAIGMWVVAELCHLLVNLDRLVQGETGTSLIALNAYPAETGTRYLLDRARRHGGADWRCCSRCCAAAAGAGDSGDPRQRGGRRLASASRVMRTKRMIFVFAALRRRRWRARSGSPPQSPSSRRPISAPQWTAYMMFMVLVGGLGTFEGPILGAVIFFAIEACSAVSASGISIGLGARRCVRLVPAHGLWGWLDGATWPRPVPAGYRVRLSSRRRSRAPQCVAATSR